MNYIIRLRILLSSLNFKKKSIVPVSVEMKTVDFIFKLKMIKKDTKRQEVVLEYDYNLN